MCACLPTQDPEAPAAELERAVTQLRALGAPINGYTNVGDADTGRYLDDPAFAPLRAKVAELGVPVYLHLDRVTFSADFPYETMEEAATWFETSLLSHNDAVKVGRENARRLFGD